MKKQKVKVQDVNCLIEGVVLRDTPKEWSEVEFYVLIPANLLRDLPTVLNTFLSSFDSFTRKYIFKCQQQ